MTRAFSDSFPTARKYSGSPRWPIASYLCAHEYERAWHYGPAALVVSLSGVCYAESPEGVHFGDLSSVLLLGAGTRRFGKAAGSQLEQVIFSFEEGFFQGAAASLAPGSSREAPSFHGITTVPVTPALRQIALRVRAGTLLEGPTHLPELQMEAFVELFGSVPGGQLVDGKFGLEIRRRLDRVRLYIEDCFTKRLSLAALAHVAGISPFHCLREFKKRFGISPNQYQTHLRLEMAKRFLRDGRPVAETCAMVGYRSFGTFSTLFRRQTGISPKAFQSLTLPVTPAPGATSEMGFSKA